jgi:segregation and condensation protein A
VEGETFSVDEKMMEIEAILSHNDKIILTNYLSNLKTKLEVIVVFLALLELIRLQEVIAKQDKNHGEIVLHKGKQFHQTGQEEENSASDDNKSLDA